MTSIANMYAYSYFAAIMNFKATLVYRNNKYRLGATKSKKNINCKNN